jgi:tetratricopeptide (TPR) repeat protein
MKTIIIFLFLPIHSLSVTACINQTKALNSMNSALEQEQRDDYESAILLMEQAFDLCDNNRQIKNYLLKYYNNFGITLAKRGKYDKAISYFEKGKILAPEKSNFKSNLIAVYLAKGNIALSANRYNEARDILLKGFNIDQYNIKILKLLGFAYYKLHNLINAQTYIKKAIDINPDLTDLRQFLNKINTEIHAQSNYRQLEVLKFDIRFSNTALKKEISGIRDHLMNAYAEIGQNFNYFPSHTIIVILYGDKEFNQIWNTNKMTLGIYDGKIRLPVNYEKIPIYRLKAVLSHEYTHALIHELSGGLCPIWINEGLAEYEESKYEPKNLQTINNALRSGKILSYSQLENPDTWKSRQYVNLAYDQSYVMIDYM